WKTHQFFSSVEIKSNLYTIKLFPDKDNIQQQDKINKDKSFVRNIIFSKVDKIQNELDDITKYLTDTTLPVEYQLGYELIKIEFDDKVVTNTDHRDYKKDVDKAIKQETIQNVSEENPVKAIDIPEKYVQKEEPKDDDLFIRELNKKIENINKEFDELHEQGELISIGHFELPSKYFTKYYFNTNYIISNHKILNAITDIFKDKFKNESFDFIVGIDKSGRIIAPNLSLKLKTNFTYVISENGDLSIEHEKNCPLQKNQKILIVTDVIASGETIKASLKTLKEKYFVNSVSVCNIFCGDDELISKLEKDFSIKIFTINKKYRFKIYSQSDIDKDKVLKKEFSMLKLIKK
ncbi:MAG: phosphoribosyltransferase family protein, partial [Bacteroidota bacterium]